MGDIARSASVRVEKIALYGNKQDAPSTPGNGGSDQSRTSLRLAWRDWSRTNEALSIYACDATVNRLIIDTVGDGIRQQYPARRRLTVHQQIESPESFQHRGNHNSWSVWRSEVRHLNKIFGRQRRRQLFKLIA